MRDSEPRINRRDLAIATGTGIVAASLPGAAMAQESTPAPPPPVEYFDVTGIVHPFTIGDFQCLSISDGSSRDSDPTYLWSFYSLAFGFSDPDEVRAAFEAGGYDANNIVRQDSGLLVDTGDQLVLIDTGFGAANGGVLLSNLEGEGFAAGDVDVVINTHGHPDHIGGNTGEGGAPTFPNARYVMAQEEWDFWADEAAVRATIPNVELQNGTLAFVAAAMLAIADRYDLVGFEEEILPGITSVATPGHTPGHMSLLLQSGDEKLFIAGDALPHQVSLQHPELVGFADAYPGMVLATRQQMFQRIADEGGLAYTFHFDPFPGLGRISADGDAWTWEPMSNDG